MIIDGSLGATFPNSSLQPVAAFPGANNCLYENNQTVTADYTITAGRNAMSCGPITIDTGVSVVVPTGSYWTIS